MKRLIVTLLMLTLGLIPTLAQEITPMTPDEAFDRLRVMPIITNVELTAQNDLPLLVITESISDNCTPTPFMIKQRQGPVLFVDFFDEPMPPSVVPCSDTMKEIERMVFVEELLTLDDDDTLPVYLAVNDQYFRVNIAQIEPVGTPPAVPPMTLTPLTRVPVRVETLTSEEDEDGLTVLQIHGILPSGCGDAPVARVDFTSPEKTHYSVDVFQLLDDPQMCPDTYVAVQYDLTVNTEIAYDPQVAFDVVEVDPDTSSSPTRVPAATGANAMIVPHVIESVDAMLLESYPVQINLTIKGYQPDGCDAPVQTTQVRDDKTVTVKIFRELPPDVACTMIIKSYEANVRLEGGFESGTYTIDVNGTVITVKI